MNSTAPTHAEILNGLLNACALNDYGAFNPGGLRLTDQSGRVETAAEAIEKFCAFGGQGWLCIAENPEILILPDQSGALDEFCSQAKPCWPRCGELVNDKKSLHLRQINHSWEISVLEDDKASDGVWRDTSLLATNGGRLRYRVGYELCNHGGLEEFRPTISRFLGFSSEER